ncbi:MAG: GNAT family N-acetyltransferase, partial [Chloroflexi bacterium]|nr:GNAT family N-acetyltransferase [Chloroflexota bacterium]
MTYEVTRGDYIVSTDITRLDIDAIHAFLTRSYWAEGISH